MSLKKLMNYVNGEWQSSIAQEYLNVLNPATQEILSQVPLSKASEVDSAARAASEAFSGWRRVLPNDRVQYLYALKSLLEQNRKELARIITLECGKTLDESAGEIQRAIENVEVACGIPTLMQGKISEDIATGIDELMIRQPVGVSAIITPFNFPGMIPFWFFPYAIACGNTCIIKPSERVPMTMQRIFELIDELNLPKGVLNLVNGGKESVDAILDHPAIHAISFVGSSQVARYVYSRAAAKGKRAQCQGGAKNPVIILPDADLDMTTRIVSDSAFGCAGQRCLAASLAITVGEAGMRFEESIIDAAQTRKVGYGLDEGVQMGPLINPSSKERVESAIAQGISEGGKALLDGRGTSIRGYEKGNFIRPTILADLPPAGEIAKKEIFGPVLGLIHVNDIDAAIRLVNDGKYGNMACLFTSSGASARKFRYEAEVGNLGINIGVAAPIAYFPFSGWKESFFGDLHAQSGDAVDFFTQKKVIIERWPKEWSRKF
jgi:malonate-semialdehyde dehydrogenase (acetylating)/methylmalonate-semialdehyde dehydrogenase